MKQVWVRFSIWAIITLLLISAIIPILTGSRDVQGSEIVTITDESSGKIQNIESLLESPLKVDDALSTSSMKDNEGEILVKGEAIKPISQSSLNSAASTGPHVLKMAEIIDTCPLLTFKKGQEYTLDVSGIDIHIGFMFAIGQRYVTNNGLWFHLMYKCDYPTSLIFTLPFEPENSLAYNDLYWAFYIYASVDGNYFHEYAVYGATAEIVDINVLTPGQSDERWTLGETREIDWSTTSLTSLMNNVNLKIHYAGIDNTPGNSDDKEIYSIPVSNSETGLYNLWTDPNELVIKDEYLAGALDDTKPGLFYLSISSLDGNAFAYSPFLFSFQKKWSMMFWLNGDNDLRYGTTEILSSLENFGTTNHINILAQMDAGGASAQRMCIIKTGNLLADPTSPSSMGSGGALGDFIKWCSGNFPAESYMLSIGGHGSGFEIGPDNSMSAVKNSWLSIEDMVTGISSSTVIIDLVVLDSCLMQNLEVAFSLKDVTKALIGSQEVMTGFTYTSALSETQSKLEGGQDVSYETLAISLYNSFIAVSPLTVVSYLSTSNINDLAVAYNQLFLKLKADYALTESKAGYYLFNKIKLARQSSECYWNILSETRAKSSFVDLHDFADILAADLELSPEIRGKAEAVSYAVRQVVLNYHTTTDHPKTHGISVFFPTSMGVAKSYMKLFSVLEDEYGGNSYYATGNYNDFILDYLKNLYRSPPPTYLGTVSANNGIQVSFQIPSTANDPSIWRNDVQISPILQKKIGTDTWFFNDEGLMNGVTYLYTICAKSYLGTDWIPKQEFVDGWHSSIYGTPGKPSQPQNPKATPSNEGVELNWQQPTSEGGAPIEGYNIERGSQGGQEVRGLMSAAPQADTSNIMYSLIATVTGTSYIDSNVSKGVTYYYHVLAFNQYGGSDLAAEVNVTLSNIENAAPYAYINVYPTSGTNDTVFTLDASNCYDNEDTSDLLEVRWDFNNDGIWDSDWSTTKIIEHQFLISGEYTVNMEVRDTLGLIANTTYPVHVTNNIMPELTVSIELSNNSITGGNHVYCYLKVFLGDTGINDASITFNSNPFAQITLFGQGQPGSYSYTIVVPSVEVNTTFIIDVQVSYNGQIATNSTELMVTTAPDWSINPVPFDILDIQSIIDQIGNLCILIVVIIAVTVIAYAVIRRGKKG